MEWLSGVEQQAWIGLLATASGLVHASDRELQADVGISFDIYAILAALSEAPDATLHMWELAGIAGYSQSRLSHAVGRLERADLISRSECPADKRAVHATLTPAGLGLVRRAAPGHARTVRELVFDRFTPEQTQSLVEITRLLYGALVDAGYVVPISALEGHAGQDRTGLARESPRCPAGAASGRTTSARSLPACDGPAGLAC